jgi:drug/metabolite transporter (DMT)-like permease
MDDSRPLQDRSTPTGARAAILPYLLLALASLLWAGNWIVGRAVRDLFPPIALNFWRWLPVVVLLAPVALPRLRGKGAVVRANLGLLLALGGFGVVLFTCLVYEGLQTTTAVNATLLNSSLPLFMILCSWALEGDRTTPRQVLGMLVSLLGILVIMQRGDLRHLLRLDFHEGDVWIIAAMPCWGIYSVLLKRRPRAIDGLSLLFLVATAGVLLLAPLAVAEAVLVRAPTVTPAGAASIFYLAVFASIAAYICWNRGVALVGPNRAGFTIHLLPAFATVMAILFLGEEVRLFHVTGILTILAGVWLATSAGRAARP